MCWGCRSSKVSVSEPQALVPVLPLFLLTFALSLSLSLLLLFLLCSCMSLFGDSWGWDSPFEGGRRCSERGFGTNFSWLRCPHVVHLCRIKGVSTRDGHSGKQPGATKSVQEQPPGRAAMDRRLVVSITALPLPTMSYHFFLCLVAAVPDQIRWVFRVRSRSRSRPHMHARAHARTSSVSEKAWDDLPSSTETFFLCRL